MSASDACDAQAWLKVVEGLDGYERRHPGLRVWVQPMLHLVEILRRDHGLAAAMRDPRHERVEPGLSHLAVTLRMAGVQTYVTLGWNEEAEPRGYAIAYVVPPELDFIEYVAVPATQLAAVATDYVSRLASYV